MLLKELILAAIIFFQNNQIHSYNTRNFHAFDH